MGRCPEFDLAQIRPSRMCSLRADDGMAGRGVRIPEFDGVDRLHIVVAVDHHCGPRVGVLVAGNDDGMTGSLVEFGGQTHAIELGDQPVGAGTGVVGVVRVGGFIALISSMNRKHEP